MKDYVKSDVKPVHFPIAFIVFKYEKSSRKDHRQQNTTLSILDVEGALSMKHQRNFKTISSLS